MLEDSKILWIIDWGVIGRKNWAEKERRKYERVNGSDYELFARKLKWFQGRHISDLIKMEDMEQIGKNEDGYKLNLQVKKKTIRIFGFLEKDHLVFHPFLFLIKKTNQITLMDLRTFEERIKKYEK